MIRKMLNELKIEGKMATNFLNLVRMFEEENKLYSYEMRRRISVEKEKKKEKHNKNKN